jgi:hypothetical protein
MGFYINTDSKHNLLPAKGKVKALLNDGATLVSGEEYVPNMVCVVENSAFEAAAYLYNELEYEDFLVDDGRPTTFLQHRLAPQLSGYKG